MGRSSSQPSPRPAVNQEELDRFIARRESELREEYTRPGLISADKTEALIDWLLREEVAEKIGADPAALQAVQLVRRHGLRNARRGMDSPFLRSQMTKEQAEEHARVVGYLEEMRATLPWWKR